MATRTKRVMESWRKQHQQSSERWKDSPSEPHQIRPATKRRRKFTLYRGWKTIEGSSGNQVWYFGYFPRRLGGGARGLTGGAIGRSNLAELKQAIDEVEDRRAAQKVCPHCKLRHAHHDRCGHR